jgi:hypothetical protein
MIRPIQQPRGKKMNKQEFLREFASLKKRHEVSAINPGSFECSGCSQCTGCMFCSDCKGCYKCTHSVKCTQCAHTSHSKNCTYCHNCSYCNESDNCSGSAYLAYCSSCTDCTYCFGCVGLGKEDFCILNERYDRDEYFKITKDLKRALGIR